MSFSLKVKRLLFWSACKAKHRTSIRHCTVSVRWVPIVIFLIFFLPFIDFVTVVQFNPCISSIWMCFSYKANSTDEYQHFIAMYSRYWVTFHRAHVKCYDSFVFSLKFYKLNQQFDSFKISQKWQIQMHLISL